MKKIKVLIIVLISILILICGILAYLYFATDILKSNKDMFNKYAAQVNLNGFLDSEDYGKFIEKLLKESHTNNGKISIEANIDKDESKEEFAFETKNNMENKSASGKIVFSQDGEEKLGISYLKNDDLYGLQCIYKQYMALQKQDIDEMFEEQGISSEELLDRIRINTEKMQNDEKREELLQNMKKTFSKYIKLAIDELPDKNYEKIKNDEIEVEGKQLKADGYRITLTSSEFVNLINKFTNVAKDDQELYDLVNIFLEISGKEKVSFTQYQNFFEEIEDELTTNSQNDDDFKLTVTMYKQGNKLVKAYVKAGVENEDNNSYIDFAIENNKTIKLNYVMDIGNNYSSLSSETRKELNYTISKNTTNGENRYDIGMTQKLVDMKIDLNMSFLLKSIGEQKYETSLDINTEIVETELDNTNFKINYSNITEFKDDIEVEKFEEGNYILLKSLTPEQLQKLEIDLENRIKEKIDFDKMSIINSFGMNESLFENSEDALHKIKIAMVKESVASVEADILSDYYIEKIDTPPSTNEIKDRINNYLNSDETNLVVKEIKEPTIDKTGTTWIIEIEDLSGTLRLNETEYKLSVDVWKSE